MMKGVVRGISQSRWLAVMWAGLVLTACGTLGYHEVKKGETLYSISWRYGEDYRQLARWNGIQPPYIIHEGQRLRLTPPEKASPGSRGVGPVAQQARQQPERQPSASRPSRTVTPSTAKVPPARKPAVQTPRPSPEQGIPNRKLTWTWPANGKIVRTFSTRGSGKKGIDIAGKAGAPVKAAAYGRVVYSGSGLQHYGNLIIIKHNARYLSAYAHNRKLLVAEGAVVEKGQKIAEMGRSGTGIDRVMLHFEIRADGKPVDPMSFLPARKR